MEIPARPRETYCWCSYIEPQLVATMLDYMEKCGVMPQTKSELVRISLVILQGILVKQGAVRPITDLQEARLRLAQSGIIDLNNPRSESTKRTTAIEQALAVKDGMGFEVPRRFLKNERKPPIFIHESEESAELLGALEVAKKELAELDAVRAKPTEIESPALRSLNRDRFRLGLGPITDADWDRMIEQGLDPLSDVQNSEHD